MDSHLLDQGGGFMTFSIGRCLYDNYPEDRSVSDFDAFIQVFEEVRSPKKGGYYITPTFDGDGRRSNSNCGLHRFAGFDLDGGISGELADDEFAEICIQMSAWRGLRYETSSSKPSNRRARFLLELDRPVSREEGLKIRKFIRTLMPSFGNWDKSCDNPTQPLFMAGTATQIVRFGKEPLPVDEVLRLVPPPRLSMVRKFNNPITAGSLLTRLMSLGFWQKSLGNDMHLVKCPWAGEHSDGRTEAYYFEPGEINGFTGGFHCFHGHCQHRNIGHLIHLMDSEGSKDAA